MDDQFAHWREALDAGKPVEFVKGAPRAGYYRVRDRGQDRAIRWDAVAIWYDDDGLNCARTGRPAPTHADEIEELFAQCNSSPISYDLYQSIANGGAWPDAVEPVAPSAPDLPPHQAIDAEMTALREQMAKWIAEIKAVKTQEEADKAGNYAGEFAKLEKRAADAHKVEKAPHLEAGRLVDAAYKPVIERAGTLKAYAKKTAEAFLIAEKRRIDEENRKAKEEADRIAREQERARIEAERAGAPPPIAPEPPPFAPVPQKAKAGTSGRAISIRTRTVHQITDVRALLAYVADMNDLPADFMATLQVMVNRMRAAGVTVPGVETKTVEEAA